MYPQLKRIWPCLLTVASFASNTTVVTKSGTIVVLGLSRNEIVVAADSRGNRGKSNPGKYDDHQCKIIALSNKFVFTFSGHSDFSLISGTRPPVKVEMHVTEQARIAFNSVPLGAPDFLARVSYIWAKNVQGLFRDAFGKFGPSVAFGGEGEGSIINGYFFGMLPDGRLVFIEQIISRQGNDVIFDSLPHTAILTDEMTFNAFGIADTVGDLKNNTSEWAKKENADWQRKSMKLPSAERNVLKAERWVQLTYDRHPGSHKIGGPIDSLTFTSAKGVQWHRQKWECREKRKK